MEKKQFLTYEEQIAFLRDRKDLEIQNAEYAKRILFKIGYFPLINGYKEAFKDPDSKRFQKGVRFEDIYELYKFDNDLRSIFMKYILVAERNVKSSLSYHFCLIYGDMQEDYLNADHYDCSGKKAYVVKNMLKIMGGQIRRDSDYIYPALYGKIWLCTVVGTFKCTDARAVVKNIQLSERQGTDASLPGFWPNQSQ